MSEPLARLIEDPLGSEKKRGYYNCPRDVNAATFDRFLEWAYRGHYTQPSPSIDSKAGRKLEESAESAVRPPSSEDTRPGNSVIESTPVKPPGRKSIWDGWEIEKKRPESDKVPSPHPAPVMDGGIYQTPKKTKKEATRNSIRDVEATASHPPEPASSQREELKKAFCNFGLLPIFRKKNFNACEDYTRVFLCHVELYVFAAQYEIDKLKVLALNELHAVLAVFKLYQERTGDIIALLDYSYAKTKSPVSGKEPLRDLLTRYVAFEMDTLMLDWRFEDLMKDSGDMLSDYMSSVLKRIKS